MHPFPEANIPLMKTGQLFPLPPLLLTTAANAKGVVLHPRSHVAPHIPTGRVVRKAWIQNCGTVAIKYKINDENPSSGAPGANDFHGVIPGGASDDDGIGGQTEFDLTKILIDNIVIFNTGSAIRAAVILYVE